MMDHCEGTHLENFKEVKRGITRVVHRNYYSGYLVKTKSWFANGGKNIKNERKYPKVISQPWHEPKLDPSCDSRLVNNQWPPNCYKCKNTRQANLHPSNFCRPELFQIEMPNQPIRQLDNLGKVNIKIL